MPYFTSNPGYGQGVNNLIRAFTSKPQDMDLGPYRAQQIQQQMVTESLQQDKLRTQISDLSKQVKGRDALAALYSGFGDRVNSYQGPTLPDQTRMEAFGPQAYDAIAPDIAGAMVNAGYTNPSMATLGSIMPGLSDEQHGRNMMASGKAINKDNFFSLKDRDTNAVYNVAGGSRAVRGDGSTVVDIAPAFLDAQNSLAGMRDAAAARYLDPKTGKAAAYKLPRMGKSESELVLGALSQGAGYKDAALFFQDIGANPQLSDGLYGAIENAWAQSGGNTAAAIRAGQAFLNTVPQSTYDVPWSLRDPRRFEGVQLPQTTPNAAPAVAPAPAPAEVKIINGKPYTKINGQWFEQ